VVQLAAAVAARVAAVLGRPAAPPPRDQAGQPLTDREAAIYARDHGSR
jgi:hypothetical protein